MKKRKVSKRRFRFGSDPAVENTAKMMESSVPEGEDEDLLSVDRGDRAPLDDNTKLFPSMTNRYGNSCDNIPPKGSGPEADKQRADCNAKTNKLCTAVLNEHEAVIPGGATRKQAWDWCTKNMKGKPFLSTLSAVVQDTCVNSKGTPMPKSACRRKILAGAGIKLDYKFKMGPATRGHPLVDKTVSGRPLVAQVGGKAKKPCRKSSSGEIRDCHYELEFFDPTHAKQKKLPGPGPYMRICADGDSPGRLFRVRSPEEAKKLLDAHCGCKHGNKELCDEHATVKPDGFGNRFKLFGYKKGRKP